MIEIKAVSKSYGANEVLRTINLTLKAGTVTGLVGRNGAGKSTLFSIIAGLEIHSGEVITPWSSPKNHTAFLPTDPYILSRITGMEYLRFVQLAQNGSVDPSDQNIFQLPLNRYAHQYSTGMKKKLAFTGLLLAAHDLIILDEPFNGVDIHSNMIIEEVIKRWKSSGKTILISSHIFSSLRSSCDTIHLLDQGEIINSSDRQGFDALENTMKTMSYSVNLDSLTYL